MDGATPPRIVRNWSSSQARTRPARRGGTKKFLRQQDTFEGRDSGWAQIGDRRHDFYAGDQEMTVQIKQALGQLPSA